MLKPGFVFYFLFLFLILFWTNPLIAQRPTRVESAALWTEMLINQKIKGKWSTQLDFQYRRRSHWWHEEKQPANFVMLPFQLVFRPWIRYQINDSWNVSLSPLGYWRNFNWQEDKGISLSHELRTSLQFQGQFSWKNWRFQQRYRYEWRFRSDDIDAQSDRFSIAGADFPISPGQSRIRWQSRFQYFLESTHYLAASTEWFVSIGDKVKTGNWLDQSRNSLAFGWRINEHLRFETGYLFHWVMRQSDQQNNHCLFFQMVIDNPISPKKQ